MDRRAILTRDISKEMVGIEVGPWFAPLVPKSDGYRCLALDVFDRAQLTEKAKADSAIAPETYARIEDVDLVGGATDLANMVEAKGLTGQIDYIISSHNFEHLPNPVLFLQGCEKALKPGGFVSMAIPDRRGCFDYFRPVSTTVDFLEAFHANRSRPTAASIFEHGNVSARIPVGETITTAWDSNESGGLAYTTVDLEAQYQSYKKRVSENNDDYQDSHCSVFTRSSFELIMLDLQFLRLFDLGVAEMGGPAGCEFYTKLVKGLPVPEKADFDSRRTDLLHAVIDESGSNSRMVDGFKKRMAEQDAAREALEARLNAIYSTPAWRLTSSFRRMYSAFTGKPAPGQP